MIRLKRENTNTKEWWEKYYSFRLNKKPSQKRTEELYKFVLPYIEDGKTLLDIGCGLGWGSALIKKHFPKMKITGMDISEEAIKFCRQNHKDINFIRFDAVQDTFDSCAFDYILLLEILEHLVNPMALFYFCAGFSKKRLFVSVPYRPNRTDPESTHINIFDWSDFPETCLLGFDSHLKMMVDKTYRFEKWKTISGWLRDAEGQLLENFAKEAPIGEAIEIGSYKGRSSVRIARMRKVTCVDNFCTGSFNLETQGKKEGSFIEAFRKNTRGFPCFPIVSDHADFLKKYTSSPAFVFIDGSHTFENALRDFCGWWKKLMSGGIMAVHDTACPAVWRALKEFRKAYNPKEIGRAYSTMGFRKEEKDG